MEVEQLRHESHEENLEHHGLDCRSCLQLYPTSDNLVSFFKYPIEAGSCLIAVPFANNSVNASISPKNSGNLSSCEHKLIFRVSIDFKLQMLSGRVFILQHPSKFNKTSLFKCPIDGCTLAKLVQAASLSISRLGSPWKFGVLTRCLEQLRSRILSLLRICQNN